MSDAENCQTNYFKSQYSGQIDLVIYDIKNNLRLAKNYDKISLNDRFRIMIQTSENSKLLILNKSDSKCEILMNSNLVANHIYYIPDSHNFMAFDGKDLVEEIYVVLIIKEDQLTKQLFNPVYDCEKRLQIISQLEKEEFDFISKEIPPLILVNGNVRLSDLSEKIITNSYRIFKKYKFNVQKSK
jgi:hypothetical protein